MTSRIPTGSLGQTAAATHTTGARCEWQQPTHLPGRLRCVQQTAKPQQSGALRHHPDKATSRAHTSGYCLNTGHCLVTPRHLALRQPPGPLSMLGSRWKAACPWWEGHAPEAAAQVDQQLVGSGLCGRPAGCCCHVCQQVQQGLAEVVHLVVDVGERTVQATALTQTDDLQSQRGGGEGGKGQKCTCSAANWAVTVCGQCTTPSVITLSAITMLCAFVPAPPPPCPAVHTWLRSMDRMGRCTTHASTRPGWPRAA